MTSVTLEVRLSDQVGALERVLGLLRRRALPIEEMSVSRRSEVELDVLLHVSSDQAANEKSLAERAIAELSNLLAVRSVRHIVTPELEHDTHQTEG